MDEVTKPEVVNGIVWPPSEFTLTLRKPVEDAGGSRITELRLREPTEDEFTQIRKYEDRSLARRFTVSLIASVPMGAVAKMAIGDVIQAENYCVSFFQLAEATPAWLPPKSPTPTAGTPEPSDD